MSLHLYRPRISSLLAIPLLAASADAQTMAVPNANSQKTEVLVLEPHSDAVKKSRTAYVQAAQEWEKKRDKDLVANLGLPQEVISKRIADEKERTNKMLQSRKAYFDSLGKYYGSLADRMAAPAGQIDVQRQKDVLQQGLVMLIEQRQQLEKEIADTVKEPSIQNQLREQLRNIERAKKTLEDDSVSLDKIRQTDAAYEQRRLAAAETQKTLAKTMQSIAESTAQLNTLYEAQYKALLGVAGTKLPDKLPAGGTTTAGGSVSPERAAGRGATDTGPGSAVAGQPSTPVSTPEPAPVPANPPPAEAPPEAAGIKAFAAVNLNGAWTYRSGADPAGSINNPALVLLQVQDAQTLSGHLTMTGLPKSWSLAQVDCDFSGPRTLKGSPPAYTFNCSLADRTGELHLLPDPDAPNVMEVVWVSRGKANIKFDQQLKR